MNDQSVNELWSLIKDGMHNTILEDTKSDLKLLPAIAKGDSVNGMVDVLLNGSDATDSSQIMTIPNMTGQSIAENDNVWVAYMYSLDNAYVMYTADQFTNGMPEWAIASELAQSITTEELTVDGHNMLNSLVYKGTLTSSDDLNNITESGIYYINDPMPSNCPTGATYSKLFVTGKNNVPTQIIFRADASSANIWTRIYGGNPLTWRAWRTFTDIDSTNALIYRKALTSADDLNNITDTGVYLITDSVPLNAPLMASTYTIVFVIHPFGNFVQQLYYHTHLTQGYPQFALRQYSGATPSWHPWRYANDMPYAKGIRQITANSDLNSFTETGVYYCSTSADTQSLSHSPYTEGIWVDGTTGFRLEVYSTTGSGYGLQIMYTHNVVQRTYIRALNGSTWRAWHRIVGDDEIYYRNNDTLSITSYTDLNGFITSSATSVSFSFYTPKSLANISSITVTAFTGTLRGVSGYLNSQSSAKNWLSDTNYTITATKMSDNMIRIVCDKSSAYTNVTNNTPVSYYGSLGLSFSTT